jgi:hypothetical protein
MHGHTGIIVSVSGSQITMTHDDGSPKDTHNVATNAVITLNGVHASLSQLRAGDHVDVVGDPATIVTATRH